MGALPACVARFGRTATPGKFRAIDTPCVQSEEQVAHAGTAAQALVPKSATGTDCIEGMSFEHQIPHKRVFRTFIACTILWPKAAQVNGASIKFLESGCGRF
jgi:hypothetical protein